MGAMRSGRLLPLAMVLLGACGDGDGLTSDGDLVPTSSERGTFLVQIQLDAGSFRRGLNPMTVRAMTPSGAPAALMEVRARMPGHAHEESRPALRAVNGGYRVEALDLNMSGRWEITFRFAQGSTQDEALAVTWIY